VKVSDWLPRTGSLQADLSKPADLDRLYDAVRASKGTAIPRFEPDAMSSRGAR
jgi:hypothetical protein